MSTYHATQLRSANDGASSRRSQGAAEVTDLDLLARWMDAAFRVPGVGVRFGLDALLGLVPAVGDAATSLVSLYVLKRAHQLGATRATLSRMSLNILLDMTLGAIPLVGDAFDIYFKANQRNVALLRQRAVAPPYEARKLRTADRFFVAIVLVAISALLVASVAVTYFMVAWLVAAAGRAWT